MSAQNQLLVENSIVKHAVQEGMTVLSDPIDVIVTVCALIAAVPVAVAVRRRLRPHFSGHPVLATLLEYLCPLATILALLGVGVLLLGSPFDNPLMRLTILMLAILMPPRLIGAFVELLFNPAPAMRIALRLATLVAWATALVEIFRARSPLLSRLVSAKMTLGEAEVSVDGLLNGLLIGVIIAIVALWASRALEHKLHRNDRLPPNHAMAFARISTVAVWLIALLLAFNVSNINLTALAAFSGALGIGVGLGLQRMTASYVSGLIVLFEQSVRVGDWIKVDGIVGCVTKMTVRYTVLHTRDGVEAVIPNDNLTGGTIVNQSLSDRIVCLNGNLLVSRETDAEAACAIFLAAVTAQPRVMTEPAPEVLVGGVTDKGIVLETQFWVSDIEHGRQSLLSDVYRAALAEFRRTGIELGGG